MSQLDQAFGGLSSHGFVVLVMVVFGTLFGTSVIDLALSLARKPALGERMNDFIRSRPWVGIGLAVVFGAMIAHFFIYIDHG